MDGDVRSPFGTQLRRHRVAAGWSQERLAEAAGLSPRAVSDLERGARRSPRLETVRMLADALGLDEEQRVDLFRAARGGTDGTQGQATGAAATPTPAPLSVPPTPLVGREREIDAMCALLDEGAVRLVTITGPGGVGKTRLALHVAAAMCDRAIDSVVFVDLSAITDPTFVLPAVARSVGIHDAAGAQMLDQVARVLADRHVLLVLDNFEQVLDAAPSVSDLLARCPGLTVLTTSRERLRLRAERVFPLSSLVTPIDIRRHSSADLAEFAAVRLFVDRARAVEPGFTLTPEHIEAIADICQRLDGLPLAIELVASRSRALPPIAMQKRLRQLLPLLADGNRDRPERQQTMRRTIAWSYDLLAPDEQRFLRWLSIFAGGFTFEAAEAVIANIPAAHVDALDMIGSLVDKSLIRLESGATGDPRYSMLETIREFAEGQLAVSGEAHSARDTQAEWCLTIAKNAAVTFVPFRRLDVFDRLEAELANHRAALAWLAESGRTDDLSQLATDLGWFWYVRGHEREGLDWLTQALAAWHDDETPLYVETLLWAGQLAQRLQHRDAAQYLERALTQSSDLPRQAEATKLVAIMAEDDGDYDRAEELLKSAKSQYQQIDDQWNLAVLDHHFGIIAYGRGDIANAVTSLEASRSAAQALGDVVAPNWSLAYLALIAAEQDRPDRAAALLREGLRARKGAASPRFDPYHHPHSLGVIAVLAMRIGAWVPLARLQGAAAADYRVAVIAMPEAAAFERAEAEALRQMGDDAWRQAWTTGRGLRQEEIDAEIEAVLAAAEQTVPPETVQQEVSLLSARELEVLRLLADGLTNHEIADSLFVSTRTVTSHIEHILTKLDVRSRTAAVAFAIRNGLA